MPVASPSTIPPPPPAPPTGGDLYQQLQAQREARQAAKNAQASGTVTTSGVGGLLAPGLVIGLAVIGVLFFTRTHKRKK